MIYSVAFTSEINNQLLKHMLREDGQEDLCFALWYPSKGKERISALIAEVILPENNDREVHGNASFTHRYFERVVSNALNKSAGIAFLHSHIGPGWQDMSIDDINAELCHAPAVKAATGFPFVGLTLGTGGSWSARFWKKIAPRKFEKSWCQTVRVIGSEGLNVTFAGKLIPPPPYREELKRTISAWSLKKQQQLGRLKIGVIGVGSVGSIVAEALARMGIQNVVLIDFDRVELHNLDRLLHSVGKDALHRRSKTQVVARALSKSATAKDFHVEEVNYSVTEERGFRKALDCDILFSCVDRPWPRSVLNYIAYAHLIPVIDGGIAVQVKPDGNLLNADWKAHTVGSTRRCLECLKQYDPALVQMEREGHLDDPEYIKSLAPDHFLKRNQNVFPFSLSLASLQVLQMLSLVINPLGISNPGEQNYHFVSGCMDITYDKSCEEECPYQSIIARGDNAGWVITGRHLGAEQSRKERSRRIINKPFRG